MWKRYQGGGSWSYTNPSTINPLTNLQTEISQEDEKWLEELRQRDADAGTQEGVSEGVIYDTKHVREGLADLSHFTDDISKYTEYGVPLGRRLDWNDIRAGNQTTGEKWRRGALKALATTGGAIAENTIGVIAGIGSLLTGGQYYDNAIGRSIDRMNEHLREEMPNYYTKAEEEKGVWGRMGTANFWADKALNGLGYSLGSVATMALTGGAGYIGMGLKGAKAIQTASALSKSSQIHKLYQIAKASKSGQGLSTMMQGIQASQRLGKVVKIADAAMLMSLAEASVESRETKKGVYDALVAEDLNRLNLDHASQLPPERLNDIEQSAIAAGNTNFALNMGILSVSNAVMFGKLLGPKYMPGKANLQGIKTIEKEGVKETIDKTAKGWRKVYKKASPFLGTAATEGTQEGFQYASNIYSTEYNTAKLSDKGAITRAEAASDAMSRLFGETDGLESIMLGIVTGGVMGGGGTLINRPVKARDARAEKVLKIMNTGAFLNSIDKTQADARTLKFLELHDEARAAGNHQIADQYRLQALMSDVNTMHDNGLMDLYYEKLDDASNLSDEEFRDQFGYDPGASIDKHRIIADVKSDIETIIKRKESLDLLFPTTRTTGLPRLLMGAEGRKEEDLKVLENQILKGQLLNGAVFLDKVAEHKNRYANRIATIVPGITLGNLEKGADAAKESYDNKIAAIIEETEGVTNEAGLDDNVKAQVLAETIEEFVEYTKQTIPADTNPLDVENAEAEIRKYYQTHAVQQELFEKWDRLQSNQGRQNYLRSALLDEKDAIRMNADAKIDELLENEVDPAKIVSGIPIDASRDQKRKAKKEARSINNIIKNTFNKYGKDSISTEEIDSAIEDRKDAEEGLPFKSDEQKQAYIELKVLRQIRADREEAGLADQTAKEVLDTTKKPTGQPKYTAMIVDDVNKLKRVYKPKFENEQYTHSVINEDPENLEGLEIGKKHKLKIIGRITDSGVDLILVENPKSDGATHSYIVLSIQEGADQNINKIIEDALDKGIKDVYYKPKAARYVNVTEGYVDTNDNVITEQVEEVIPEESVELQAKVEKVVEKGPVTSVEGQIEQDEYEVHITGDMISGWDLSQNTEPYHVPGIIIKDLRGRTAGSQIRSFEESIQNGKKVFTIVDNSIYRGSRSAAITASMVFDENTPHTLESVKDNLNVLMDNLLATREKGESSFDNMAMRRMEILNFKEIATPTEGVVPTSPIEESREETTTNKPIEKDESEVVHFENKELSDEMKAEREKLNEIENQSLTQEAEGETEVPVVPGEQTMEEMKAELETLESEEQDLTDDLKEEDDQCATGQSGQTKLDL